MDLLYTSGGRKNPRFFKIKKKKDKKTGDVYGEVSRISCAEYDNPQIDQMLSAISGAYFAPRSLTIDDARMILFNPLLEHARYLFIYIETGSILNITNL